jgi:hypothetical protein
MSLSQQALAYAQIEAGQGSPDDRVRLLARNRLQAMLSVLDSKTSVLLRFNAIVVAALAYVTLMRGVDPFAGAGQTLARMGIWVGHLSLVASVVSCGLAFPVINIEKIGNPFAVDEAALGRLGALVTRRTTLYAWAWRLAVAGGAGFALLVALATIH